MRAAWENVNNLAPVQMEAGGQVQEGVAKFNSGDGIARQILWRTSQ